MKIYSKEELLRYVAPCSLICYTCPACDDGAISQNSKHLCKLYEGYYDFNDQNLPKEYRGWLDGFKKFYNRLKKNTQSSCPACRNNPKMENGCIKNCYVRECYQKMGVNFCGECSKFPCKEAKEFFIGINNIIGCDWERGNLRIKEVGIHQYFEEKKGISHYISYKKDAA